jgi:hypothetical protein
MDDGSLHLYIGGGRQVRELFDDMRSRERLGLLL